MSVPSAPPGPAGAQRLAVVRIVVAAYAVVHTAGSIPEYRAVARRPDDFDPVGLALLVGRPLGEMTVTVVAVVGVVAAGAVGLGWRHRVSGPVLAVLAFGLASHRSSFGQVFHFDHLLVLHLMVLGVAPAGRVWSLDARRRARRGLPPQPVDAERLAWWVWLMAICTVMTYLVAAGAKLRVTGLDWIAADTLRGHIAYSSVRLELLGHDPPMLGRPAVSAPGALLSAAAGGALALELAAPVALLGRRVRWVWAMGVFAMHVTVGLTMSVWFTYQASAVAMVPLFNSEVAGEWVLARTARSRCSFAGA